MQTCTHPRIDAGQRLRGEDPDHVGGHSDGHGEQDITARPDSPDKEQVNGNRNGVGRPAGYSVRRC
jgi:hypothetical protein